MTELFTAFIWGLGVSCGAAIGCLAFLVAKAVADWMTGKAAQYETLMTFNRKSHSECLAQLTERNDLTRKTNVYLELIAQSIEERE